MNKILKKYNLKGATKSHSKAPSVEDKASFCKMMYEITEIQLGKIVQVIAEDCGDALDKTISDEVEVNVDAIDGATFKKIDALIKSFAKEAKADAKKGKVGCMPPFSICVQCSHSFAFIRTELRPRQRSSKFRNVMLACYTTGPNTRSKGSARAPASLRASNLTNRCREPPATSYEGYCEYSKWSIYKSRELTLVQGTKL